MDAATLDHRAQAAAAGIARKRIPLFGRLTPEQVAEHNAFIDEMRELDRLQDYVSQPSRFVGIKSGLPHHTTL